jgi:dTDP-4-amino-4,6-dideoxygalactose transaminase
MNIKFNDLQRQWETISIDCIPKINKVLETGNFILGSEVEIFENNFKKWNNNKYAVGVGNGTDAISISVSSLSLEGKSIFYIPANTYIATLLGVVLSDNKNYEYKLIDCDDFFQMDMQILEQELRTNSKNYDNVVVIPVHLYGISCDMKKLMTLKSEFNFKIIEDCSQSHGTITNENKKVGTYGDVSAFSLYPGKNLGACGDAGVIVTNDEKIYKKCLLLRNLGSVEKYNHEIIGKNSRLDTLQAVILNEKLKYIDEWNKKRNLVAQKYQNLINSDYVFTIEMPNYCKYNTYHLFVLVTEYRESFINYLKNLNIPTLIHYPIPIELSGAFYNKHSQNKKTVDLSKKIVSIPMHPFLTCEEVNYISSSINKFKPSNGK